jgi:hypothetical protein
MKTNETSFTIQCPVCKNKQTGFVQNLSYARNKKGWSCVIKGCVGWLNADELTEYLQLTVSDLK